MVLDDTRGTSPWLSHCDHPTHRRERRIEDLKIEILSHAGYESSLIFNRFQWFGDSIPNKIRGPFLQRESKHTETLIGRHPIGNL